MTFAKLFQAIQVGEMKLTHRVVMAPLGLLIFIYPSHQLIRNIFHRRLRATANHIPGPNALEYYTQRADTPGTFIIAEATEIAEKAGGYAANDPSIFSYEQIAGWKKVVNQLISISLLILAYLDSGSRPCKRLVYISPDIRCRKSSES